MTELTPAAALAVEQLGVRAGERVAVLHNATQNAIASALADGRLVSASGEAGAWLERMLDSGGEGGRSVAELGIGTNPAATLCGVVLEDEKLIGTAHVAFGSSAGIGGVVQSSVHIDSIMLEPTVAIAGETVVAGGRLVFDPA